MLNFRFIFSPGSCGWFCIRFITKKKLEKESYMTLFRVKEILNKFGYYCSCLKINDVENVDCQCLSLIKSDKRSLHYVVIINVKKGCVYYYDPLFVNIKKKKIVEFVKKWSGICLIYTRL